MSKARRRAQRRIAVVALLSLCGLLGAWFGSRWAVDYVHQRRIDRRVDTHRALIERYAHENDLPFELVRAVVRAESSGNPQAVSSKDARGLMQITDAAEQDVLRVRKWPKGDIFDPEYNIKTGTAYLRLMARRFDDDHALALAAYHMGARRVQEMRKAHPGLPSRQLIEEHANPTTRRYCRTVLNW